MNVVYAFQNFADVGVPVGAAGRRLGAPAGGSQVRAFDVTFGTSKFDLTLSAQETAEGLRAAIEYSTDLFEADTIRRMLGHLEVLLEGIAVDPDRRLSAIPLLTREERRRVLARQV